MIYALAIVVASLAADLAPAPVSVKVLYGTGDESQKAEIESWISKFVVDAGSPIAAPYTAWIKLTGDEQELYASMMGGRLIKGKVAAKDGSFEVEIFGFKIGALKRTITLKPGERQVLKLTDYPAPNNVFIALEADTAENALTRLETKLHGEWRGGPCMGDWAFAGDGSFVLKNFSPGGNTFAGAWTLPWEGLPPTLVLTFKSSDAPQHFKVGQTWEVKLVQLDDEAFAYKRTQDEEKPVRCERAKK
jgi:hypothetical protein